MIQTYILGYFIVLPLLGPQTGVELHLPSDLHTAVISPSRVKPLSQ